MVILMCRYKTTWLINHKSIVKSTHNETFAHKIKCKNNGKGWELLNCTLWKFKKITDSVKYTPWCWGHVRHIRVLIRSWDCSGLEGRTERPGASDGAHAPCEERVWVPGVQARFSCLQRSTLRGKTPGLLWKIGYGWEMLAIGFYTCRQEFSANKSRCGGNIGELLKMLFSPLWELTFTQDYTHFPKFAKWRKHRK